MARLISSGFELQSLTSGVEFDTVTGSPTINTTIDHSGLASMRCNPTAAAWYVQHDYANDTVQKYIRAYIYIQTSVSALADIIILGDDADDYPARIRLATNDTLELWNGTAKQGSSSSALSKNTWYYVELSYLDSGALTITGQLNGVQFATGSCAGNGGNGRFRVGIITATTGDVYFDDIAVNNNAAGGTQTTFPGAGSIVHLYPNADGDNKQWQDSASATQGTSTFGAVDETTPNDATDYNKRTTNAPTTTPIDDWNVQSPTSAGIGANDTIKVVSIGVRAGATSTTSTGRSIKTRVKSAASGTTTASASTPVNVNGWITHKAAVQRVPQLVSYTDPTTGIAWTPTGTNSLENMQIGYQADVSSVNEIRVSDVWALVEFTPVPLPGKIVNINQARNRAALY